MLWEREITHTVKLLNYFTLSKSHPGGFMQQLFKTSKVKEEVTSMEVTVMILGLVMLKTCAGFFVSVH